MTSLRHPIESAALTDVVFLVDLAPSSLAPISVSEMHLYAYLANLVALNNGVPVSDWGYAFSLTTESAPAAARRVKDMKTMRRVDSLGGAKR